jgi:hypothetical protein
MGGRGRTQSRLHQLFDIQFSALVRIQPLELGFHEFHVFFFGYLPVLIGIHKKQQLHDVVLAECKLICRFRNCRRDGRLRSRGLGSCSPAHRTGGNRNDQNGR